MNAIFISALLVCQFHSNPDPVDSSVRIRITGDCRNGSCSTNYGSGTVIYSSDKESLIMTCGHIFQIRGNSYRIIVDTKSESAEGRAVDYDFGSDLGLIKITPRNRLPVSKIVPSRWKPSRNMSMLTAGHSEGRPVTAWRTKIVDPQSGGLREKPGYEAIECQYVPAQGRSGGGLFTDDGYLAGVCNFAVPGSQTGLYASPRSMYAILSRNNLAVEETTCRLFSRLFNGPNNVQVNVNPSPSQVVPAPAPTLPSTVTPFNPPGPAPNPSPIVVNPPQSYPDLSGIESRLAALEGTMGGVVATQNQQISVLNSHTLMLQKPITFVSTGPQGPISVEKHLGETLTLDPFKVVNQANNQNNNLNVVPIAPAPNPPALNRPTGSL